MTEMDAPSSRTNSTPPGEGLLHWVSCVADADLTVLRGLRDGGSPWLLQAGDRQIVLRTGRPDDAPDYAAEVAGLQVAAEQGIPAPRLLGHDLGLRFGFPVVITSCLTGTSTIPREARPARLRQLGAVAASLHLLRLAPSLDLPHRDQPIGTVDFDEIRAGQELSPLLREARDVLASARPPDDPTVFVHGDLWQGNVLWLGDILTGLVDWDCAGVGAPGVDLGSLRLDAAFCFGPQAADEIIAGWERVTGTAAPDVAYWDLIAGFATPPDLGWFPDAIAGQGRPDLTRAVLLERRDAFLRRALDRLS